MKWRTKALTGIEVIAALAIIGVLTWLVKPALLPGASRNAAQSTTATAKVEATTHAQDATAAASVVKIGEANATAPASPSKDFISQEVPVALASLPAPDPIALLAAEKRRSAVMEGRIDEARKLYEAAAKRASQLQTERDNALAERRAVDLKLETAAAAEHARTVQLAGAVVIALLVLAAWIYAKIYGIHPNTAGQIVAAIRGGQDPIQAFDTYLAPRLHGAVRRAAKLATEPTEST